LTKREKIIRGLIRDSTDWAVHHILELEKENAALREEIEELEDRCDWTDTHGQKCDCIECKVPGADEL